jgi:hypothetical protein
MIHFYNLGHFLCPFSFCPKARNFDLMAEANQFVQSLLGQRLRVEIDDGRMIVGEFYCLDRDLNVVLYDASETRYKLQ